MLELSIQKEISRELTISAQPQETGGSGILPITKLLSGEKPFASIFQKPFLIVVVMLDVLDSRKPQKYFAPFVFLQAGISKELSQIFRIEASEYLPPAGTV